MATIARQAITVDPDLHSIWGDLDGEAFDGLKSEIHADGIRDSLILWKQGTENILIDGHNRLRIAEAIRDFVNGVARTKSYSGKTATYYTEFVDAFRAGTLYGGKS